MIRTTRNISLVARALCGIGVTLLAGAIAPPAQAIGSWQACPRLPFDDLAGIYPLTDGTILGNGYADGGIHWYKYTPDAKGDYTKGTWTKLADSPWGALYFVSFTLNDGKFWMAGGEYISIPEGTPGRSNHVQIYDPATNTWTQGADGLFGDIGDVGAVLLNDGRPMTGYRFFTQCQIYNLQSNTWTQTGSALRGNGDEATWQTLADGSIFDCRPNPAQRYIPGSGQWINAATCPIAISTDAFGAEQGPITYLQNGQLWCASDNGPTALYTPPTTMNGLGSWTLAASYPNGDTAGDTPSAMEINGKVLVVASDTPSDDIFGPGTYYEYDPATNSYATLPDPPAGRAGQAFTTRLMPLPGGQILYTRGSDLAVYISEEGTGPKDEWRPTVSSVTPNVDGSYTLTGTQITGRSFGSNYGDDFYDTTNFPIVYLKDAADKVYFCKSYDFSTRAIWTGTTPVTCKFTAPAGLPAGSYSLFVSANGVTSKTAVSFPPVASPVLTGLTPATVGVGTTGTVLTLTGSAFAPTATVNFNGGAPVTPASVTSTKITVAVPTSVLTVPGAYDVRVHNLGSPADSAPLTFTVATPVITSLSPGVVTPGATGVVLSISGSGYQRASKVSFNGAAPVTPTYVTTTLIQVPVPDALLASSGSVAVTVVNTTAPGGTSAPATLAIAGKPTLTSVTPASSGIGATGLVLTLTGTGFTPQAKVTFNGATPTVPASVTSTQITVAVPAALLSAVGSYALRVQNPGVSNTSTDNVVFKTLSPVISNIIPTAVSTTAGGTGLTINGANFIPGSTVTFGGVSATPISITTTKIVVPIPASAVQLSGQVPVVVVNTQGAGGSSNTVMLTVAARPTITALTPHLLALGGPNTTMTITGTSFQPGATVLFNDTLTVACTVKSTTEITVVAPASLATTNGTYFLRVVNVGAGNISNAAQYNVAPAQPVITSLSPDRVVVGLTSLNLYIYGTGFINGSKVTFNNGSPVDATYQSGRLIAPVPANLLATVGNVQVRVVNGPDNGGTSVIANFTVAARAALTSVSPTTVGATDNPVTLTLNGSNFENGAVVTINDSATVTPTSVTPTQITIILPTSVASTPGTYYARVINPGYANNSGIQKFTVVPAP